MGLEAEVIYDSPLDLKRFFLNKERYSQEVANDFELELIEAGKQWVEDVQYKLADHYPLWQAARQRPDAEFPHHNTGDLMNSVFSEVHTKITKKNVSFSTIVGISAPQGLATNAGKNPRKDGTTASWVGWQDSIFGAAQGQVQTVTELFDWLHELRTQL